jgi:hypothetical protein
MLIDLTKLIILLVGMWANGAADDWDVAAQVRFSIAFPGPTAALELALDPVPIYYRPLSPDLCGISIGIIVVDQKDGCSPDVLQHEINHAWQLRTWGLAFPISYLIDPDYWEAKPQWNGTVGQPAPRSLNWPLFRFWLPLEPGGEKR